MTNATIKRAVPMALYLLFAAGLLGNAHAADDGINTHAPYLTFDPNTGKFVEVDPSKTGAAGQGGGQNTAAAQSAGTGQNSAQPAAAAPAAPAAPAQPAAGQGAAADQAAPGGNSLPLVTAAGAVVLIGVLGALVWSRRRKREAATSA